jgi:ATP/maltotriose-dependent transcriptional regulator MalT
VRRDQNDEQLFWLALLEAIRNTVGKSQAGEPLAATPGFDAGAMVDRVLSELGCSGGRIVLVMDDLHELAPTVETHLTRLVTELPAHVHAVLGTCRDLPLRLHQLRLAGELAEIRAAAFAFRRRRLGSFWQPRASSCPTRPWQLFTRGRRAGQRGFALQQSRWLNIRIRSDSSLSSPAVTERLAST